MRKYLPQLLAFCLGASLVCAGTVFAGTIVDQGSPGKYGPWPVTGFSYSVDGGSSSALTVKFLCETVKSGITIVDGGTVAELPADGGLPGRWFIRVCASSKNSGNKMIACTDDGQAPSMSFNGVGESIEEGDCRTYYTPNTIKCVSSATLTGVTTEECK